MSASVYASAVPSGSLQANAAPTAVPAIEFSARLNDAVAGQVGASLSAVTDTVTVSAEESSVPSLTVSENTRS